jgi:hypothetical protein
MNQAMFSARLHAFSFGDVVPPRGSSALNGLSQDFRSSFKRFAAMRHALYGRMTATPVTIMGRADFVDHVVMHLPDVATRIAEDDFGILHLEMGAMKLATREAIRRYELHTMRRHFAFIAYLYEHADHALYGAIVVSYLEPLFIDETEPAFENARGLLPPNLADALKRAELRHALLRNTWLADRQARAPDPITLTLY